MQSIGIVVAFSERCQALLDHFLLTLERNVIPNIKQPVEVFVHVYQCNFVIVDREKYRNHRHDKIIISESFQYQPFEKPYSAEHLNSKLNIIIHDCSSVDFSCSGFYLPDIAVYQDFCDRHSKPYDYLMFCHDDIAFYEPTDMIDKMLLLLNGTKFDIVANCSTNFNNDLSIRFHPAMIFVKRTTFEINELSFINNLSILNHSGFRIFTDGGAGLMASYYKKGNVARQPYSNLPTSWFTHIRAMGDTGVEFCYQYFDEIMEFRRVMDYVQSYNDRLLFG